MWLLNARTKQLETFVHPVPPYAILSHVWEQDELTFQDIFTAGAAEHKRGWLKVDLACKQTLKDNLAYVWIDTCCIDKSSSAELSEAINSMFRWYQESTICYVFLKDVTAEHSAQLYTSFVNSRWFTRGWTLQELIAPKKVDFYNAHWIPIGTKQTLAEFIHSRTKISRAVLHDASQMRFISVSSRMLWAAERQTTRIEDIAYCLLGVFGVNMPLMYGEGLNAFTRLQEEIIKISDDQSIFAWDQGPQSSQDFVGSLAASPTYFVRDNVRPIPSGTQHWYSMSHKGLRINIPLIPTSAYCGEHLIHIGLLQCQYRNDFTQQIVMYLSETDKEDVFARCMYRGAYLGSVPIDRAAKAVVKSIYIEGSWKAKFELPSLPAVTLQLDPHIAFLDIAQAAGVGVRWNYETLTARLSRSPQAYDHDLAVGFILKNQYSKVGATFKTGDCAFLVVLHFPHRSLTTTKLGGLAVYSPPNDWDTGEWIMKAKQDLSLIHIRETLSLQFNECKVAVRTDREALQVLTRIDKKTVLNQDLYTIKADLLVWD